LNKKERKNTMQTFIVRAKEIYYSDYEVLAKNEQEALSRFCEGDAEFINDSLEYSHTDDYRINKD